MTLENLIKELENYKSNSDVIVEVDNVLREIVKIESRTVIDNGRCKECIRIMTD